jgi:hypothetical protein
MSQVRQNSGSYLKDDYLFDRSVFTAFLCRFPFQISIHLSSSHLKIKEVSGGGGGGGGGGGRRERKKKRLVNIINMLLKGRGSMLVVPSKQMIKSQFINKSKN